MGVMIDSHSKVAEVEGRNVVVAVVVALQSVGRTDRCGHCRIGAWEASLFVWLGGLAQRRH